MPNKTNNEDTNFHLLKYIKQFCVMKLLSNRSDSVRLPPYCTFDGTRKRLILVDCVVQSWLRIQS